MPSLEFVVPGDPATATGGYIYDRCIVSALSALGWRVQWRRLCQSFPFPEPAALDQADRVLAALPADSLVVVDGLALGAMPLQAEIHAPRLRLVGLVHHPLALETGLESQVARRLHESERRALGAVRRVLVTSTSTAAALEDYGVAPPRIGVVEPGTPRRPPACGSRDGTLSLLCVAALAPRKGHDVLFHALHRLREGSWRLTCVGSLERSPQWAAALRRNLTSLGLESRVELMGEVDEAQLGRYYAGADVFVLPSRHEGYGMALAEALAYGLPIVSTRSGAISHTVPPDAALLVTPDDSASLAQALARLMSDEALRRRLASGARRAASALPSWADAAARFARELEKVTDR